MHVTRRPLHYIGWAATTLALAATTTTLSAPTASADVGPITVNDCTTRNSSDACAPASSIVVGHVYQVVSPADIYVPLPPLSAPTVNFYDNGQCIAGAPSPSGMGVTGIDYANSSVSWVPNAPGTHKITVTQASKTATLTVNVVAAPPGSTAQQPPQQAGCGGGGSIGSGSSNLLGSGSAH
ncbi:hypothetical protein ACFXPS_22005 [Nocardia sp. NPDC059091]|uniref:hypothetical protein n=1 Tax=unclassified Nocardia TaxID=2637762 RepID=UPI0036A1EBCB